jgi:hypothetical protein
MQLPYSQTINADLNALQTKWRGILNPFLAIPLNNSTLLTGIPLINGVTVVNHTLGRMMQGWILSDVDGAATIYRSAPLNDLTLTLTSSAAVIVSLAVF